MEVLKIWCLLFFEILLLELDSESYFIGDRDTCLDFKVRLSRDTSCLSHKTFDFAAGYF